LGAGKRAIPRFSAFPSVNLSILKSSINFRSANMAARTGVAMDSAGPIHGAVDPHARDAKLALDQLALAARNLKPHPILMPMFGLVICVINYRLVPLDMLATWFIVLALAHVPLAVVSHQFTAKERAASDLGKWTVLMTAAYSLSTLAWSAQVLFLWAPGNDLNHLLMVLFLAGYLSGQSPFASPSIPLVVSVFAIDGSALVAAPLREGGFVYDSLAVIALFYAIYTMYMANQMYLTARSMLLLRTDKNDLIVALGNAKAESDRARYRAEAASKSKSQFLANMSHELRTPLNAILGFSEMLASRAIAPIEKHYEYAEHIHRSGNHLLTLINDILDLAKIEAGAFSLREANVDVGRVIADEVSTLEHKIRSGGCTIRTEISDKLPLVYADERAIKQIMLNLLSNAAKFTPSGGSITAFAEVAAGAALCFGVADTGIGITPEDQARVFENFGQGRHDVVTKDKGTGLGLPIVKGLAEAHGGRVSMESKVGEGTRIVVYLPASRARPRFNVRAA
jgi:two-component system cell cycle sensor histidine kinase PleC